MRTKVAGERWLGDAPCCKAKLVYDKRRPGVFKVEFRGLGIVALCSKTYYCFGDQEKVSCKGLSKTQNPLIKDSFMKVLKTHKSSGGVNKGFRTDGRVVYTYAQERRSLSFFYPKRRVQKDGVSTDPILV